MDTLTFFPPLTSGWALPIYLIYFGLCLLAFLAIVHWWLLPRKVEPTTTSLNDGQVENSSLPLDVPTSTVPESGVVMTVCDTINRGPGYTVPLYGMPEAQPSAFLRGLIAETEQNAKDITGTTEVTEETYNKLQWRVTPSRLNPMMLEVRGYEKCGEEEECKAFLYQTASRTLADWTAARLNRVHLLEDELETRDDVDDQQALRELEEEFQLGQFYLNRRERYNRKRRWKTYLRLREEFEGKPMVLK